VTADSILSQFKFTPDQRRAATRRSRAIAVTAGAGSGKTRVLVGRYLHLLEQGQPLRSLIAITFTEKAAREMRTRIRAAIQQRLNESQSPTSNLQLPTSDLWQTAFTELDAARIGTIHSLCAEILRAHPAEAEIDPNFTVLEEGQSAAWQAQAIEAALVWATTRSDTAALITLFTESRLRDILTTLIAQRLDVAAAWQVSSQVEIILTRWIDEHLTSTTWLDALSALSEVRSPKADDRLEIARRAVIDRWQEILAARATTDWDALLNSLAQLRTAISTQGQKTNWAENDLATAREAMKTLRDYYETEWLPLIGKEATASWLLDRQLTDALPAVQALHARTLEEYQRLKDEGQTLDFDDLEGRAARLLTQHPAVRERWQQEVRAALVDEFQDTNARQRDIVYALTGFQSNAHDGELFIVADPKQSIYKFRGADVAVFRQVQSDIQAANGLTIDLDITFRAHHALVQNLNDLLRPVLGEALDHTQPYEVPFAELRAQRQQPEKPTRHAPYVEFQVGLGENAANGREAAAAALAQRLITLRREEDFAWSDMALLFRASSGFNVYEEALERAGIPFITIAGRGFYDRPEIRDVLNALAAIHDPTDDLALAGLLRSPAMGLSDADIYRLRFATGSDQPRALWETLKTSEVFGDFGSLIAELHDLSGRVAVAEVLKRFLDRTHYRTLLSAVPQGHRLRRNVDKLLADAHASRLISLGEFLEYVQTLEDVGVREGEAPVEAGGAVQLMTVHKAKGLEFPVTVIADAAHEKPNRSSAVLLDDQLGLQIDLSNADKAQPITYRLARLNEQAKDDAEDKRLLYVAATRAKEKLIISGHAKVNSKGDLSLQGWLKRLGAVTGLDLIKIHQPLNAPLAVALDQSIGCVLHPMGPTEPIGVSNEATIESAIDATATDLSLPLSINHQSKIENLKTKVWRVIPKAKRPVGPAWVVGQLTHQALRRWRFPDADNFDAFLWPFALEAGLTDRIEIQATINEVRRILKRFQAHALYAELAQADRFHEVPYTLPNDAGVIDLLYGSGGDWTIVDFKTDEVRSIEEMRETIEREKYAEQVRRYIEAITIQIGQRPRGRLVFLRVGNIIQVEDI
jgi:ATP-dependent helicase/nuclease subunit A